MIYLDNAATTRPSQQVIDAMMPWLYENYGNPGSLYGIGTDAKRAVKQAREQVAALINADPGQIIFTSGGSEANSMALRSVLPYLWSNGNFNIAYSNIEHDSIINCIKWMRQIRDAFDTTIAVSNDGTVSPGSVRVALSDLVYPNDINIGMVSVMAVNNETGAVNDVKEISAVCHEHGALFHTDCVQAASSIPLDVKDVGCDFMSLSSHKLHGPKGIGALYVQDKTLVSPLIFGGAEQEFGLRGGTENVPAIVGFGKACELMKQNLGEESKHTSMLKQIFFGHMKQKFEQSGMMDILHLNCNNLVHPGRIVNFHIDGVDAETLVLLLSTMGVCVSTGSACRSHEQEPSRVLLAMGIKQEDARNSVRVSFSGDNTEKEAKMAAEIFATCVSRLRNGG